MSLRPPALPVWRRLILALLVAVGVAVCTDAGTELGPGAAGAISGQVTAGGEGLAGVTVSLSDGATTTTAAGGVFRFDPVEPGNYAVTISGYPDGTVFPETTLTVTVAGRVSVAFQAQASAADRAPLVAFYNATGGPNWSNNTNWLTDAPLGDWYGVDTNAEGRVEGLELPSNGLTGSIPPELGGLASLESLRIGGNDLTGSIPPRLGDLTGLKVLRLQNNELTGSLPPGLGGLSRLTELWVHRNRLSGSLPLSLARLAALESLRYNATGLCVPLDDSFRAWLNGIPDHRGTGAACAPGQVTGVTVTEEVRQLAVSWNAVTGADGYKVQWKSGTQSYDASREAVVTGTSHTIPNLTAETQYTVRVIATRTDAPDGIPSAEATGTPLVAGPNPPGTPAVSNQTATAGQPFSYQFDAVTDRDGDPVTYVARLPANTPLPAWLSFDEAARTFSGTPGADDVGEITINVIAFDPAFNFSMSSFTLTVVAANSAPEFSEGAAATRSFAENTAAGENIGAPVAATDADGDALTYELRGRDGPSFEIVSASGQLRTKAGVTYDFETKSGYSVTVSASDGNGGSDSIEVTINLTDVPPPDAPDAPTVAATEGSTTSLDVKWIEPANTGPAITDYDVRWRWNGGNGAWTELDDTTPSTALTATITGLTPNREYAVQVRAQNDEGDSDWSPSGIGLTVVGPNPPSAPTLEDQTAVVGQPFRYQFNPVTDPDGDPVSYAARLPGDTPLPAWLSFDAATRTFSGTPSAGDIGEITINVLAFDGALNFSMSSFTLTVVAANRAPEFSEGATATRSFAENTAGGEDVGAPVAATDADGDALTYTLYGTDGASFEVASASGQLRTKAGVTYDFETSASYSVTVSASDGNGGSDSIDVTVNLTDVPPPDAPAAPTVAATAGSATSLDATWAEPANTGPAISDYDVRWRVNGSTDGWTELDDTTPSTALTASITGLAPDTEYEVQVRAQSAEGASAWSPSGTSTTTLTGRSLGYAGSLREAAANDGSVTGSIEMTLTNDTFTADVVSGRHVTAANVPAGLTARFTRTGATVVTLTLSRSADSHADADDVSDLTVRFADGAFTAGDAASVTGSTKSDLAIDFRDPSSIAWAGGFTEAAANDGSVTGSVTATLTGDTFGAGAMWVPNLPQGLGANFTRTSPTVVTLTLWGRAIYHADKDDVNDLTVRFSDNVFTNGTAATVRNSSTSDLAIDFNDPADRFGAYLTQAVQSRLTPVPLVAGEAALLRIFLTASSDTNEDIPRTRATFFAGGSEIHSVDIPGKARRMPTSLADAEASLDRSANVRIPGSAVRPGLEMVIEIDPARTLAPGLVPSRIPESGRLSVPVEAMPAFDLTLVPALWTVRPDSAALDLAREMAAEGEDHRLLWDAANLLPIGEFNVSAHEPILTSSNSVDDLILAATVVQVIESGTGHYMALLTGERRGANGIAEISGRASAVAVDVAREDLYAYVIAHEIGHNFSLRHAPCGVVGTDPAYPYSDGWAGAWGIDTASGQNVLVPPSAPDLMGYCYPAWISDYHFTKAGRFRSASADVSAPRTATILVWGGRDADGTPFLNPAFSLTAAPALPSSGGEYEIVGRDADGRTLFSLSFDMAPTADGEGGAGFAYAVPVPRRSAGLLGEITLSGPGGSVTLDGDTDRPMAILRDSRSGRVRGILRDLSSQDLARSVEAMRLDPGRDVLLSRGIPTIRR